MTITDLRRSYLERKNPSEILDALVDRARSRPEANTEVVNQFCAAFHLHESYQKILSDYLAGMESPFRLNATLLKAIMRNEDQWNSQLESVEKKPSTTAAIERLRNMFRSGIDVLEIIDRIFVERMVDPLDTWTVLDLMESAFCLSTGELGAVTAYIFEQENPDELGRLLAKFIAKRRLDWDFEYADWPSRDLSSEELAYLRVQYSDTGDLVALVKLIVQKRWIDPMNADFLVLDFMLAFELSASEARPVGLLLLDLQSNEGLIAPLYVESVNAAILAARSKWEGIPVKIEKSALTEEEIKKLRSWFVSGVEPLEIAKRCRDLEVMQPPSTALITRALMQAFGISMDTALNIASAPTNLTDSRRDFTNENARKAILRLERKWRNP